MEKVTITTQSENETIELGLKFAERLNRGDTVLFYGDLGSGKTEFIKGICRFFNVQEIVTSPTFTIMNQYLGDYIDEPITIFHIDLYRIKTKDELSDIGFEEYIFSSDTIKLIEWSENSHNLVKFIAFEVTIKSDFEDLNERLIEIKCY